MLRVLVACECSGVVRDAFIAKGHDAISCDIKPSEKPGPHYQGDVRDLLEKNSYDLMIAHPPCTYLARVSAPSYAADPSRKPKLEAGAAFFRFLWEQSIPRICIENPYPLAAAKLVKWSQVIQPYMFGHPFTKGTCLWLKNLPPLAPTALLSHIKYLPEEEKSFVYLRKGVKFATAGAERSKTFFGIAEAMADQWGSLRNNYGFF
jgi:hypothetical protein